MGVCNLGCATCTVSVTCMDLILLLGHVTNAMNRMMYFCSSFDILSLQLVMNVSTLMFPLPRSFFCENFEGCNDCSGFMGYMLLQAFIFYVKMGQIT